MKRYNIDCSIDVLRDSREFKKSILVKLHPDKGGCVEDFKFVKNLEEELNSEISINRVLGGKLADLQAGMHSASIGLKMLDGTVDFARLVYEPTVNNVKSVVLDVAYMHGMYYGGNSYSAALVGGEVLYHAYNGAYEQALKQAASSMVYLTIPQVLSYIANPYLGFAYSAGITAYTTYGALSNAYGFYLERSGAGMEDISHHDFASSLSLSDVYDESIEVPNQRSEANSKNIDVVSHDVLPVYLLGEIDVNQN